MERSLVAYDHGIQKTLAALPSPGLLLAARKRSGQVNVMTIGWGALGIIWGKPIFTVLVRPSRYTYEFIEDAGAFTVNVPSENMREWVTLCGTHSGRDLDKFTAYHMSVSPAKRVPSITIDACPMVYECKVVHHNDVIPAHLSAEIEAKAYHGANYHRIYFGEILGAYAAPEF